MAAWQPASLSSPAALDAIAQVVADGAQAAATTIAGGSTRLAALGLPDSGAADAFAAVRQQTTALLATDCQHIVVTPYQYTVGKRRGEHAYLTPDEAITAVADRLQGAPPATDIVLLCVAAPDEAGFAASLARLRTVVPLESLWQAERRAAALAELEQSKFIIPDAPLYPAWQPASPQREALGRSAADASGRLLALCEGTDKNAASPARRLLDFADRLQARTVATRQQLEALRQHIAGADTGWYALHLHGSAGELPVMLRRTVAPVNAAYKCCAAVCWHGTAENVQFYRQLFGL